MTPENQNSPIILPDPKSEVCANDEYKSESLKVPPADQTKYDFNLSEPTPKALPDENAFTKPTTEDDFEPDEDVLNSLCERCFSFTENEYTYELCMFKEAKQHVEGKGFSRSLGSWAGFTIEKKSGMIIFKWTNGQMCGKDGPNRSATAFVTCGIGNKIISVDESKSCKYEFKMESTVVCDSSPEVKFQVNTNDDKWMSNLLRETDIVYINKWLKEAKNTLDSTPKIIYRASRDGWYIDDFHYKCDNKGATITVVKTLEGNILGGYSDKSWSNSEPSYYNKMSSENAFLFSLKNPTGFKQTKLSLKPYEKSYAIYTGSSIGPSFRYYGRDLCVGIEDMKKGYTLVDDSYQLPPGMSKCFLTGKDGMYNSFDIEEIEVFQV